MKITFITPAPDYQRFHKRRPFKGSIFFRHPYYDYLRLKKLYSDTEYIDERIMIVEKQITDTALIPVYPYTLRRAAEISVFFRHRNTPVVFCGPLATIAPNHCLKFCDSVLIGDITASINKLISEYASGALKKQYHPEFPISFGVDRQVETLHGFVPDYSQLRLSFGCGCKDFKAYCYDNYLYPDATHCTINNALLLVSEIKRKRIVLLDDGIDLFPEFYQQFFRECWYFHKEWNISASGDIFEYPGLLLAMKRAGVRVINLKADWLIRRDSRQRQRDLAMIHHLKMIPGITLVITPDVDISVIAELLKLSADFCVFPTLTPIPFTNNFNKTDLRTEDFDHFDSGYPVLQDIDPKLVKYFKDRYYSLDQIWLRLTSAIRKIGIYNAFFYLLPINLAFRQNFLEGIPYPP